MSKLMLGEGWIDSTGYLLLKAVLESKETSSYSCYVGLFTSTVYILNFDLG